MRRVIQSETRTPLSHTTSIQLASKTPSAVSRTTCTAISLISRDTPSSKKFKSLLGELNQGFQETNAEKLREEEAHRQYRQLVGGSNRIKTQIIWSMIDREYCRPYCSSWPGGVLNIHNLYFTQKPFFPSFDSPSHLPHNILLSLNELLQTAFQMVPPSFSLLVSSSYRISFRYRNL